MVAPSAQHLLNLKMGQFYQKKLQLSNRQKYWWCPSTLGTKVSYSPEMKYLAGQYVYHMINNNIDEHFEEK